MELSVSAEYHVRVSHPFVGCEREASSCRVVVANGSARTYLQTALACIFYTFFEKRVRPWIAAAARGIIHSVVLIFKTGVRTANAPSFFIRKKVKVALCIA